MTDKDVFEHTKRIIEELYGSLAPLAFGKRVNVVSTDIAGRHEFYAKVGHAMGPRCATKAEAVNELGIMLLCMARDYQRELSSKIRLCPRSWAKTIQRRVNKSAMDILKERSK